MATNVDEEFDVHVDTDCIVLLPDGQNDTPDTGNGQSGIFRRTRLLNLGRLLLHLVCLGVVKDARLSRNQSQHSILSRDPR